MWRITDDFWDNWEALKDMFTRCERWQDHVKKGCYPDCDMLPLGFLGKGFGQERRTNFTEDEQRTMLTLWCIFGSPLMLGCELTKLDDETLKLITDEQILGLLAEGRHGRQLVHTDKFAAWINEPTEEKAVDKGSYIALFNLDDERRHVSFNAADYRVSGGRLLEYEIPAHGSVLVKL